MSDEAVKAAVEALRGQHLQWKAAPALAGQVWPFVVDAEPLASTAVAAARAAIEAEVRAQIAAEIEAHCLATHNWARLGVGREPEPIVCPHCRTAARIARGES